MIDSNQFLKLIKNRDPHLGNLLESWFDTINVAFNTLGVDPRGKTTAPPPIAGINVATGSDHVHVTLNDSQPMNKNIQYIVEYSVNDPSFAQPHVEHLGASRGRVLALPAKDSGGTSVNYYFRAYSQYMGSDPQTKHIYYGSTFAPTAVTLTGASRLTMLPSQGSGTGRSDGTQGGAGLGFVINRPPVTVKRPPAPQVR